MQCPICHTQLRYNNDGINVCPSNHGVALSSSDLLKIKRRQLNVSAKEAAHEHDRNRKIDCPQCSERMQLVDYNNSGIIVDACLNCHTRWLDRGELDRIVKRYSKNEISSFEAIDTSKLNDQELKLLADIKFEVGQSRIRSRQVDRKFDNLMIQGRSRWQNVGTFRDRSNPSNITFIGKVGSNIALTILIIAAIVAIAAFFVAR